MHFLISPVHFLISDWWEAKVNMPLMRMRDRHLVQYFWQCTLPWWNLFFADLSRSSDRKQLTIAIAQKPIIRVHTSPIPHKLFIVNFEHAFFNLCPKIPFRCMKFRNKAFLNRPRSSAKIAIYVGKPLFNRYELSNSSIKRRETEQIISPVLSRCHATSGKGFITCDFHINMQSFLTTTK